MRFFLSITFLILALGCQKTDNIEVLTRSSYLVFGKNINCNSTIYNPSISMIMDSNRIKFDKIYNTSAYIIIDIDHDGKNDLSFHIWNEKFPCSVCLPDSIGYSSGFTFRNYSNFQICKGGINNYYIKQLFVNDTISSKNYWDLANDTISNYYFQDWHKNTDCFMGLRKINNNDTCYGWLHLYYSLYGLIIKDFAIQK